VLIVKSSYIIKIFIYFIFIITLTYSIIKLNIDKYVVFC